MCLFASLFEDGVGLTAVYSPIPRKKGQKAFCTTTRRRLRPAQLRPKFERRNGPLWIEFTDGQPPQLGRVSGWRSGRFRSIESPIPRAKGVGYTRSTTRMAALQQFGRAPSSTQQVRQGSARKRQGQLGVSRVEPLSFPA